MKTPDLKKLRKEMEKELNGKRYEHTLSVAYTAANLAMIHGEDSEKALVAGMLHDCAKCISGKKLLSICQKNNLEITETEKQNPSALLHAKVGSFLAKEEYGVEDEEILNAIRYHTTGHPKMSRLEKILYIADYIEPGRKIAPNLFQVRQMAYQDLDKALLKILEDTLNYLQNNHNDADAEACCEKENGIANEVSNQANEIDPMTMETYKYYKGHYQDNLLLG